MRTDEFSGGVVTEGRTEQLEGVEDGRERLQLDRESLLKFVDALRDRNVNSSSPAVRRLMAELFASDRIDLRSLAGAAANLLTLWPRFNGLTEDAAQPDSVMSEKLRLAEYLEPLDDPLVHGLLRRAIVPSLRIERLLTVLRRTYLLCVDGGEYQLNPCHLRVMVSLACQCFNNEYVYAVSPAEQAAVEALRRRLEEQLATGYCRGLEGCLATYAMYAPLWTLHADMRVLEMSELQSSPDFRELIGRQVREHAEEEAIRKEMTSFGMSGEPVTDAVRQLYEGSPYPRWLDVTIREPVRYADEMARLFPFLGPVEIDSPVRVLIAGCGTGYHAIQVAAKYSDATVLAIDISKTSLAYAIRQARRHGLSNIEFLHGDLLRIERLGKQFDAVESVGVLHCLADPIAGFRALTNVLAPGGFMKIGLYSRRARLGLASAQRLAKSRNIGGSPDELRLFRQDVIATECDEGRVGLADISDFFYLSGFRDLICHVQELQFTPAELKGVLQNVNVSMLGYRGVKAQTLSAYRERFPEDPDMRDFDLVDRFETDHPDMFANLQTFWLRKNAS